jgi:hypothetical protein
MACLLNITIESIGLPDIKSIIYRGLPLAQINYGKINIKK